MPNLSFSKSPTVRLSLSDTMLNVSGKKKGPKGCAGCLFGCIGILTVFCLIFVSLFSYVYFMDKNELIGTVAVKLLKNQSINFNITTDLNSNNSISFDEKIALNFSYDKFLSDYDSFPVEKQKAIKINFGILIKKLIHNPVLFQTGPPPKELEELVALIIPDQNRFKHKESQIFFEEKIWHDLIDKHEQEQKEKKKKKRRRKRRRKRRYDYIY